MIDGQYYKLGYYDTQADNLTWFDKEKWDGGKVSIVEFITIKGVWYNDYTE